MNSSAPAGGEADWLATVGEWLGAVDWQALLLYSFAAPLMVGVVVALSGRLTPAQRRYKRIEKDAMVLSTIADPDVADRLRASMDSDVTAYIEDRVAYVPLSWRRIGLIAAVGLSAITIIFFLARIVLELAAGRVPEAALGLGSVVVGALGGVLAAAVQTVLLRWIRRGVRRVTTVQAHGVSVTFTSGPNKANPDHEDEAGDNPATEDGEPPNNK